MAQSLFSECCFPLLGRLFRPVVSGLDCAFHEGGSANCGHHFKLWGKKTQAHLLCPEMMVEVVPCCRADKVFHQAGTWMQTPLSWFSSLSSNLLLLLPSHWQNASCKRSHPDLSTLALERECGHQMKRECRNGFTTGAQAVLQVLVLQIRVSLKIDAIIMESQRGERGELDLIYTDSTWTHLPAWPGLLLCNMKHLLLGSTLVSSFIFSLRTPESERFPKKCSTMVLHLKYW